MSINKTEINEIDEIELRKLSEDISMASDLSTNKCCSYLFTNQRNDFFADNQRSKLKSKKSFSHSFNKKICKKKEDNKLKFEIKNFSEEKV